MALTDEDVREILRLIDESELDELRIETADFKLHVVRGGAAAPEVEPEPARPAPRSDGAAHTIQAPMPGTFYRAEGPGMAAFVDVGTEVEPDTVVCLIEIMKMMNSVQAGVSGTVVEICVEDAELVADGAPLFRVAT
ncbi:MAG: acetyl-CoA carboxylase biotin carboxyl carrier protein [Thermoleophilaceae bacterium]|jgi:acetyl-CoA carboxylase biotin carboxyl carrier protein|nr:acetyl-CoA carboxylase biotin carboxyl carrier protein [Thermoleophilaceae bacterium]